MYDVNACNCLDQDVQDKDSRDVSSIFFTNSKSNRTKNPDIIVAFIFSITKLMWWPARPKDVSHGQRPWYRHVHLNPARVADPYFMIISKRFYVPSGPRRDGCTRGAALADI